MKTKIVLMALAGMLLASCELHNLNSDELPVEKPCDDFKIGTLITVQVNSPSLEGNLLGDPAERSINVYLPKGYNLCSSKRYPVIYYLHGLPAGENSLINPSQYAIMEQVAGLTAPVDFPEEGFIEWINNLIDNGGMKEAIIVMPNAVNKYAVSFYTNNAVQGNYEDYIVKDVVSYIDSHFKTIPHFNFRALTGHSAGGYGALKLGMKHPNIFGRVAGLSPGQFPSETIYGMAQYMLAENQTWGSTGPSIPYHPEHPFKFVNNTVYSLAAAFLPNPEHPPYYADIPFTYDDSYNPVLDEDFMNKFNSNSLFALASEYKVGIRKLKTFYFDIGTEDDLFMYQPNQAFHEYLSQMHIKHQYAEYEGTHFNKMFERLGKVWTELSNDFPNKKY